jgi:hypothetical protein
MAKPLHLDPKLSDAQRAFVAVIPPGVSPNNPLAFVVALHAVELASAWALIARAISPGSVPAYAFNVGLAYSWIDALSVPVLGMAHVVAASGMLGLAKKARTAGAEGEKATGAIVDRVAANRRADRRHVSRWLGRAASLGIGLGLAMNGYLAVPAFMAAGWMFLLLARALDRDATIDAIKAVVVDGGVGGKSEADGKGVAA